MLNLITVCTDDYPMIYAEKLHSRFASSSTIDVKHFCLTDRPSELPHWINALKPFTKSYGWWNKINLFHKDMPEGMILYLDVDIVITQNFDHEIKFMQEQKSSICCVSDAINWKGNKFSSSLLFFRSGIFHHIYLKFIESGDLTDFEGGDQVWLGPMMTDVCYLDDTFPFLKKSLKFQLATRNGEELRLPLAIDKRIKLIDCSGEPKPHSLARLGYVRSNWHDV